MSANAPSHDSQNVRVLVLENVHESAVKAFQAEGFQVEIYPRALNEEELIEKIKGQHLLCIRSKTKVTKKVLDAADELVAIGCFCIGTDQVDLEAAQLNAVPVFNAPFSNTRSVAELVLGEILCLARGVTDKSAAMHRGRWLKSAAGSMEVRGKTLGIIGYGHIGSQLSILAEGLGMRVVYWDVVSVLPIGNGKAMGSLEELLGEADFVSLHVPKAPSTKNMISKKEVDMMKQGAFLINASRGTVVDIGAVADGLREGKLGGVAVDVFPVEPAKNGGGFETALQGLPNVILTPHIGGSTAEAQKNIGLEVAGGLIRFNKEGLTGGSVNFPKLELRPHAGCHRIVNVHRNCPGVLGAINGILSDTKSNVSAQALETNSEIGYLVIDVDIETSHETKVAIESLETSIVTRILY